MAEENDGAFAQRRGWTLRQRLRAPDSYGLLLPLIIVSLFATAISGASRPADLFALVFSGGTLLFALYTSRTGSRVMVVAIILIIISLVAVALMSGSDPRASLGVGSAARLLLSDRVGLRSTARRRPPAPPDRPDDRYGGRNPGARRPSLVPGS